MVTVAFERIALPHTPPGKKYRLQAGAYDHGFLLPGNLANIQKRKQRKGKLAWHRIKIE